MAPKIGDKYEHKKKTYEIIGITKGQNATWYKLLLEYEGAPATITVGATILKTQFKEIKDDNLGKS